MKIKKLACLTLALMIIATICSCGKKGVTILQAPYDKETQHEFSQGEAVNVGDYTLTFDEKLGFPILAKEGATKVWDSSLGDTFISSSIYVKIYDPTFETFSVVKSADAVKEGRVKSETITNGLRVTYYFDEYEISVPVYYTLNENGLKVKVVPSEIEEHAISVMAISLNPYLCKVKNEKSNDKYLFIPSGSGALMYTDVRGEVRTYEEEVYGNDLAREEKWRYNNSEQINLPVFGAVDGNDAIYGIITSGAEYASIGASAGERIVGSSGVYPIFNVRAYNSVQINIGGVTGLKQYIRIADKRNPEAFEVQYSMLSGEDASYSGIADAYREYLNLNSGVKNKLLNLTLLGGVMADRSALGIPYKTFSPTTTIEEATDIISQVYEKNGSAMNIRLLGFGNTGLTVDKIAGAFKVNSKIGSKSEIKKFEEFCKQHGLDLFMDYDVLQFVRSGAGYSKRNDVTVDTTDFRDKKYTYDIALRNVDTTQKGKYLLGRDMLPTVIDDLLKSVKKYNFSGVSLDTLGSMAYSDFTNTQYYGKGKMDEDVAAALKKITDANLKLLTVASNDYAAKASSFIDAIPTTSSGIDSLDVDIPFYGIVFSGCKENSVMINLSSEPRKKFLEAIKTGSGLSFVLANEINSDVIGGVFSAYISADYESNKKDINEYYTKAKDFLNSVSGSSVKSYEILEKGVTKTVFENGVTVYVNETTKDTVCEKISVEAMGFKVR